MWQWTCLYFFCPLFCSDQVTGMSHHGGYCVLWSCKEHRVLQRQQYFSMRFSKSTNLSSSSSQCKSFAITIIPASPSSHALAFLLYANQCFGTSSPFRRVSHGTEKLCDIKHYVLTFLPLPNFYVEVPITKTPEGDLIWKQGVYREVINLK